MKVTFVEDCTVYPDGSTPQHVRQGQSLEVSADYAALLEDKGHIAPLKAAKKKEEKA